MADQQTTQTAATPPQEMSLADRIKQVESKYTIPAFVKEKFPDLVELVLQTESMNEDERDYWFQILPIMTEEQIAKFRGILVNEKSQIKKLDEDYSKEVSKLNEKHSAEWTAFEHKKKREAVTKAEANVEDEEKAKEEALLKQLEGK